MIVLSITLTFNQEFNKFALYVYDFLFLLKNSTFTQTRKTVGKIKA